jgi:hypothetical protein
LKRTRSGDPRVIILIMQPTLRAHHWLIFLAVNVLLSAVTALFVVQAFIQTLNRATPTLQAALSTPTAAPTATAGPQAALPAPPPANPAAPNPPAPSPTNSPAPRPQVRITNIIYPGQRTREVVVLANEGETPVELTGWTLSTPRGVRYTFGNVVLPGNSFINLYTTSGVDVPTSLFWNQPEAVWRSGDVATLARGDEVIATYTVR